MMKQHEDEEPVTAVIRRARQLIERGWCQRMEAADKEGRPVIASSPAAVAFCLRGALWRASDDFALAHATRALTGYFFTTAYHRVQGTLPRGVELSYYNDAPRRRSTTIPRKLDRAAAKT